MPGIQRITHDGQGNAFWAGNNLYVQASASQATGAAAVTIADLIAGAQSGDVPAIVGAQALTIVVYNDATAQTITGLSLTTTGKTASGGTGTITYPVTQDVSGATVNIASGSSQTFFAPLSNGVLETFTLTPTFGAAPAAGTIETLTTVHTNPTASMQLIGSNVGYDSSTDAFNTHGVLYSSSYSSIVVAANSTYSVSVYTSPYANLLAAVQFASPVSNVSLRFQSHNPLMWVVRQATALTSSTGSQILQPLDWSLSSSDASVVDWNNGVISVINSNSTAITIENLYLLMK